MALGALGALGCAPHRPRAQPGAPGASEIVVGGVSGAQGVSLAVVPPYTNERCPDGRVFIVEGGSPVTTTVDLPCFERGDCGPAGKRASVVPGAAGSEGPGLVVRLQDYSILNVRMSRQGQAGRPAGAAWLARSTDCGDSWTASTVDAGALGGGAAGAWERLEDAYADPWDPRGLVYLAIDATDGGKRRTVIAWSSDFGKAGSWRAQPVLEHDAAPGSRVAMAAPAGGRLYLLDVVGTSPRLTPIVVDPTAGALSVSPSWYVFQSHVTRAAAPDDSRSGWDDATPGGSLGLAATGRLAGVDHLTAVYQSGRAARVLEIDATGTSTISSVKTTALPMITSDGGAGSVAGATLVEGPPGSLAAALTWVDEDAATHRGRALWAGLAADPRTLASARTFGPAPLSTEAAGAPRAQSGAVAPDPAVRGAGYRGSGGFAGFLLPWIEASAPPALHVRAAEIALSVPWEHHIFDDHNESWYTDGGDWAWGRLKGDCSSSAVVVGLSANPHTGAGHSILCHDHLIPMLATASVALDFSVDSRIRDSLPDWDVSLHKGECAADEAVTGMGQMRGGRVTTIRCTRMGGGFHRNACSVRVFEGDNDRGSLARNDWAWEFYKTQCTAGQIVKGVSTRVPEGTVHAILCCYVSVM